MSLPKEVRERIRKERKQFRRWEREEQASIQQCGGTTKAGLRCRRTLRGNDLPSLYGGWQRSQHRIECPHCKFLYPGWGVDYFGKTPLGQHRLHRHKDEDGVPTGFGCTSCGCTFDPQLDLVEHGRDCAIWGSGPRPGSIEAAMLKDPEFLNKAVAHVFEEERKRKRLQEWRKQQEGDTQEQP
jgi:hypothetical protein